MLVVVEGRVRLVAGGAGNRSIAQEGFVVEKLLAKGGVAAGGIDRHGVRALRFVWSVAVQSVDRSGIGGPDRRSAWDTIDFRVIGRAVREVRCLRGRTLQGSRKSHQKRQCSRGPQ